MTRPPSSLHARRAARFELPTALAAAAARPAVTIVTQQYLDKHRAARGAASGAAGPEAEETAPSFTIYRVVKASLEAGLGSRDVSSGVMLGVLASAGREALAHGFEPMRDAASATMAACLCYGGRVRESIDGILAAAAEHSAKAGADASLALAAASAGVMDAVGGEPIDT